MALERSRSAAVAAALAVAACLSGSSDGPLPVPGRSKASKLEVYGRDIVLGWATVTVMRDGAPDTGASVVVNGAALPPWASEPGAYSGPLATPIAIGGAVLLEVTSGRLRVVGTGAMPERPFILAAYTSAAIASDGDIVVTWTSPSDPDRFVAAVTWSCGLDCGAGTFFPAAGSARQLTIPAGALPPGLDVEVAVFAYDDGVLEGDCARSPGSPGMNIRAESSTIAVATLADGQPPARLEVRGQDIGEATANVVVTQNGQPIDDAEVAVNGEPLPLVRGGDGWYMGTFARLYPGDPISLDVTRGALRVTGLGHLPDSPLLVAPTNGTAFSPGQDVVVRWTSASDPDYFQVNAKWSCGPSCGTGTSFTAAGATRSLTIPHGALPPGTIQLSVFAYDDGAFTGDYAPYLLYPGMNVRAESGTVTVSR